MEGTFLDAVFRGNWHLLLDHGPSRDNKESFNENSPLVASASTTEQGIFVYRRRWLVLISYILIALANNLSTYSYSSIADIVATYYNVSETKVNLLLLVYMFSGFSFRFLAMWIIDTHGLALGVVAAAWLTLVGCWVRIFPGVAPNQYYFALLGQSISALGQAFVDLAAPKLAANWFPPDQRTTATSLGYMPLFGALFLSYAVAPRMVLQPERSQLERFLLCEAVLCTLAAIAVFTFFRGRPPLPPSPSQQIAKTSFRRGIVRLFADGNFVLLFIVFCLAGGGSVSFAALLDEIAHGANYNTEQAGLFGSVWIGGAMLSSALVGPLIDRYRRYKLFVLMAFIPATLSAGIFALDMSHVLPHSVPFLIVAMAVMGLAGSGIPAVLEAAVECTFPMPEATVMGVLFLGMNVSSILLTLLLGWLQAPDGSLALSMWILVAVSSLSVLAMFLFREEYRRLEYEQRVERNAEVASATSVPFPIGVVQKP